MLQLTSADRDETKTLLPLLQHIADDHSDPSVKEMATDLRIAIATHGIVLSELARKRTTDGARRETKERVESGLRDCESSWSEVKIATDEILGGKRSGEERSRSAPLIEVLSSRDNNDTETTSDDDSGAATGDVIATSRDNAVSRNIDAERTSEHTQEISSSGDPTSLAGEASSLEQALVELCDSLIPVRGHGLITLTRLLRQRDRAALSRTDLLMTIFRENLAHPDTYIYLQAVAGLSALGDVEPGTVLPALLREYSQGERSAETRLKLGEAIVRISRSLGESF